MDDKEQNDEGLNDRERQLRLGRVAQSREVDTLNRSNPTRCAPSRHVVVVVGVTGGGKSSTANTMRHSNRHTFQVSSSITSVTQSISYRDYSYDPGGTGGSPTAIRGGGHAGKSGTALTTNRGKEDKQSMVAHQNRKIDFRIIDTPGLQDTNRRSSEIQQELDALVKLAPHGISAFVVCVPMGRVTEEHQAVLQDLTRLFGPKMIQHSVLVVTSARTKPGKGQSYVLLTRNDLMEQMGKLPLGHFLREWVEGAGWRLVGVENVLEPYRTQSSLRLHQAVMDTLAANQGQRYQFQDNFWKKHATAKKQSDTQPPNNPWNMVWQKLQELQGNDSNQDSNLQQTIPQGIQCRQSASFDPNNLEESKDNNNNNNNNNKGKIVLTIQCEIDLNDYNNSKLSSDNNKKQQ